MKEQTSYSDKRKRAVVILILLLLLLAFFGSFFFIRGRINANAAEQSGMSENNNEEKSAGDKNSSGNNNATNEQLPVVDTDQGNGSNQGGNARRNNSISGGDGNQNTPNNVVPEDTTAPEITGIENGKYYAQKVKVEINADDLASAKCKFEAEDGTVTEFDFKSGDEFSKSGKYTLTVKDETGNVSEITFTIDTNNPTLKLNDVVYEDNSEEIYANDAEFKIENTDKNADKVFVDDVELSDETIELTEGTHTIKLTDKAGNEIVYTIIVDRTAPVLTWKDVEYTDGSTIYANEIFTVNATDANDIAQVSSNGHVRYNGWRANGEGKYTIKVTDIVGNEATFTVIIDKTAPTLKLNGTSYTDTSKTIYSNADSFTAEIEDKNADKIYVNDEEKSGTFTLEEGTYTVKVTDLAGNETVYTLVVDRTNPTLKLNGTNYTDSSKTIYSNATDFTAEVEDTNADKVYVNEEEKTGTFTLEEGTYSIKVTDLAGNENVYTLVVDRTVPVLTLCKFEEEYTGRTKLEADKIYNYSVAVIIDEINLNTAKLKADDNTVVDYVSKTEIGARKDYTLTVTDLAGNVSTISFGIDKDAPKIEGVEDGKYYNVDVAPVVTDKHLDKVTYTFNDEENDFVEGTVFTAEGKYTITAVDKAGNSTTKTFYIDKTAPVLEIKDDSIGTDPYYSRISFKLRDNMKFSNYYTINGTKMTVTPAQWGDADFTTLRSHLHQGENTIELIDMAGNKTTKTFIYDTVAPALTLYKFDDENTVLEAGKFYNHSVAVAINEVNPYEAKLVASDSSEAEYVSKTEITTNEYYTLTVTDKAGNSASVEFGVDTEAPQINGVEDGKYYNVDVTPEVTDKNLEKVTYTFNGVESDFVNGTTFTEEGSYTITATDIAGNKTTKTFFIDKTAPVLEIKDDSLGEDPYYRRISFKLKDNMGFKKYILNGITIEPTIAQIGDANYDNIVNKLHQGENTITLVDQAGNETTKTFIYDTVAPALTLYKFDDENTVLEAGKFYNHTVAVAIDEANPYTSELKADDNTVVGYTSKTEILGDKFYTLTVSDKAGNSSSITFGVDTQAPQINGVEDGKYYNVDVTPEVTDKNLEKVTYTFNGVESDFANETTFTEEGSYTITATDIAGNKTTKTFFIDKTAPVLSVKNDSIGEDPYYSKISFALSDNMKFSDHYTINGTKMTVTPAKWGDADFSTIRGYLHQGENTITLTDLAGNETTMTFIYDTVKPTITVKSDSVGTDSHYSKISFALSDNTKFNYYTINGVKGSSSPAKWGDANFSTIKGYLHQGENTIVLVDLAGNKAEQTFIYDTVEPTATVTYSNNNGLSLTKDDVIATLIANESIRDLSDWTKVDDKTFTKVFAENIKSSVEIMDLAGNTSTIKYEVKRIDKIAPTIALNGDETEYVALNGTYTDAGITVTDNYDNERQMSKTITITWDSLTGRTATVDAVDPTVEGKYTIEYKVTDRVGNTSTKTRTVFVQDNTNLKVNAPTYDTSVAGQATVIISANKRIKPVDGWEYVDENENSIKKVYTENMEYPAVRVYVEDLKGKKTYKTVMVDCITTNGKRIINVSNKASFLGLAKAMNDKTSFENAVVNINCDIDLTGTSWTAIYAGKNNVIFNNTVINGNNHTISGLTATRRKGKTTGKGASQQYGIGLFGDVSGENLTIKNLKFDNVNITDANGETTALYQQHYAGVVIGRNDSKNLVLENIEVKNSKVINSWQCGGLVGYSGNDLTFNNCNVSNIFVGGAYATSGTLFGMGAVNVNINNCTADNIRLYTDGLAGGERGETVQSKDNNFWIGDNYKYDTIEPGRSGKEVNVSNSSITNVTVVDQIEQ